MEYKLPPLPESSNDNRKYGRAGFHATNGPVYTAEQMQAYAIAAIEAQASVVQQEPVDYIVSVVVIKSTGTGFNTQNKLYPVEAVSREEAHGKALNLAGADFPEHNLHTICSYPAQQAKPQPDPLHDDIQSVLFEVEQAIQNGCCPWQVEAAFEAYEAARRLQQTAHGIKGS